MRVWRISRNLWGFLGFFYAACSAVRHRQFLPCAVIAPQFRLAYRHRSVSWPWCLGTGSCPPIEMVKVIKASYCIPRSTIHEPRRPGQHRPQQHALQLLEDQTAYICNTHVCATSSTVHVSCQFVMVICTQRSKSTTPGLRSASSRFLWVNSDAQNLQYQTHNAVYKYY